MHQHRLTLGLSTAILVVTLLIIWHSRASAATAQVPEQVRTGARLGAVAAAVAGVLP